MRASSAQRQRQKRRQDRDSTFTRSCAGWGSLSSSSPVVSTSANRRRHVLKYQPGCQPSPPWWSFSWGLEGGRSIKYSPVAVQIAKHLKGRFEKSCPFHKIPLFFTMASLSIWIAFTIYFKYLDCIDSGRRNIHTNICI